MEFYSVEYSVVNRCVAMGLSVNHSREFEALVAKWVHCSGARWTVDRLKALKVDMIRTVVGQPPLSWIKRNRSGEWKGVLGVLRKQALGSNRGFKLALNVLACYTAFKPKKITKEDRLILRQNLEHVAPVVSMAFYNPLKVDEFSFDAVKPLLYYEGSPTARSPVFLGKSVQQTSHLEAEYLWFENLDNLKFAERFKEFYSRVVPGYPFSWRQASYGSYYHPFMGNVVPLTKDGGMKIRWIANPLRIHQMANGPLGDVLFKILRKCPWDYTHRQEEAIPVLQAKLREGKTLFSVDLKSATDFFPLDLQFHLLTQMNSGVAWQDALQLFYHSARGVWKLGSEEVCWRTGQPMGLYPSFPAFSLSHGLVLANLSQWSNPFVLLGDDLVIWDSRVYELYRNFLARFSIPLSEAKCITSDQVCEFAGQVIKSDASFHVFKWRNVDDENFIEMMCHFGKRFRPMLTRRQKFVYDSVCSFQRPFGCNHSVDDLVKSVAETPEPLREIVGSKFLSFLHFAKSRKSFLRFSNWFSDSFLGAVRTFDEKVSAATRFTHFERISNPTPGATLLRALHRDGDLPTQFSAGKRISTLEAYEKYLKANPPPPTRAVLQPSDSKE